MSVKTWDDVTPLPTKVIKDSDNNTVTVYLDMTFDAQTLKLALTRPDLNKENVHPPPVGAK